MLMILMLEKQSTGDFQLNLIMRNDVCCCFMIKKELKIGGQKKHSKIEDQN